MIRTALVLQLFVVSACPNPPPNGVDAGLAPDGGTLTDVGGGADIGINQGLDAGTRDTGSDRCPEIADGVPELCLTIDSQDRHPVPQNFSGFNVQNFRDGWQAFDERLVAFTRSMTPGNLRFPGGGTSYAYHWRTGSRPEPMVERFYRNSSSKRAQVEDWRDNIAGKGYLKLDDLAELARRSGAKIIIDANTITDSVESVGAWARKVVERGYEVVLWELTTEPHNWGDAEWCHYDSEPGAPQNLGPCPPFFDGGDGYAAQMRPYYDAIVTAYTDAGLEAPPVSLSTSDTGDTERQRRFDGVTLEEDGYHAHPDEGIAWYGSALDPNPGHSKYWDGWNHHWYPGKVKYQEGEELIEKALPGEPTNPAFWTLLRANLNHELTQRATQHIDNYYLKMNGQEGFGGSISDQFKGYITEYNLRFRTPQTGTMFSAIHAVESVLRWSAHPRVGLVAYHALSSKCQGALNTNRTPPIVAANQNYTVDSADFDYGRFEQLPCVALRLLNRAVNTAQERLDTTLRGGSKVIARESVQDADRFGDYRYHLEAPIEVPASYAAVYRGRDGMTRVLITNRSATPQMLTLILDGRTLRAGDLIAAEVIHAPTELYENDGDVAAYRAAHPNAEGLPASPVDDLAVEALPLADTLTLPAWSVVSIRFASGFSTDAPPTPTGLVLTPTAGGLEATWQATPGATAYRVHWGVRPGVYTATEEVEVERLTLTGRSDQTDLFVRVAALRAEIEGPGSLEQSTRPLAKLRAHERFDGTLEPARWSFGCGSASGWSTSEGELARSVVTGSGSCAKLIAPEAISPDQWIRAQVRVDEWAATSERPRVGLVGRCPDDDHCVQALIDYNVSLGDDPPKGKARIIIRHPDIAGGWMVVGRSQSFDLLPAVAGQQNLGLLNPIDTELGLDLDGQTIRFWYGTGENRRLIAAALDAFRCTVEPGGARSCVPFNCDEGSDGVVVPCVPAGEEEATALTQNGPAGVFSRRQTVHYSSLRVR